MTGAQEPGNVSTVAQRIAISAREHPQRAYTSLAHHLNVDWLREAWERTRKDGAVGIDGMTAERYAEDLERNLADLLERAKAGSYRAPAVRRVHIPKGDGRRTRPIGIPTLEDKVLQRAVAMVLEPLYEQDFVAGSFGFRPGRSAHQALQTVWSSLMAMGGGWVLELDIESFFDTLDHGHLRAFLDRRVRDGVLRRLIDKWLKAGVMEDGVLTRQAAERRKAASSRPCWRTSTCTTCSTNGSSARCARACVGAPSSSVMRMMRCWSLPMKRTLGGYWTCCRSVLAGSGCDCTRARRSCCTAAHRALDRPRRASTCSASLTTGRSRVEAVGCSSARRPRIAWLGPCEGSSSGAGCIVMSRWRSNIGS